MFTYLMLGDIGLLFNIAIFSSSTHHRNSFSLYILAASLAGLIGLNSAIIPILFSSYYRNLSSSSLFLCQFLYYLRHAFSQMMRTFFVLGCIDRYAATCGDQTRFRRVFYQYSATMRIIFCVVLAWLAIPILPSRLQTIQNGLCDVFDHSESIVFSIYVTLVVGVLPLAIMIPFGSLLVVNLRKIRARVQPVSRLSINSSVNILRKRDRDMIRMSLLELLAYICTAAPLTVLLIYRAASHTMAKSEERQEIERFLSYLTRTFLLYLNNGLSFWIYLSSSRSFRLELKHLAVRLYELLLNRARRQVGL